MPTLLADDGERADDDAAAASLAEPASLAIASTRPPTTPKAPPTGIPLLLHVLVADEEAPPTGTVARGVSPLVELVRITEVDAEAEAAAPCPLVVELVMPMMCSYVSRRILD